MNDFRKHIKDAANNHKEPVDIDAIWTGIQKKMDPPKKERRLFPIFLWCGSISFLIAASIGYLVWNNEPSNIDNLNSSKIAVETSKNIINPSIEKNDPSTKTFVHEEVPSTQNNTVSEIKFEQKNSNTNQKKIQGSINSKPSTTNINYTHTSNTSSIINASIYESSINNDEKALILEENTTKSALLIDKPVLNREYFAFQLLKHKIDLEYERPHINIPDVAAASFPLLPKRDKQFSLLNSITLYAQYGLGSKTSSGEPIYAAIKNESEELMEQIRIGLESDLVRLLDFTIYGGASYVSINDRINSNETYFENRPIRYLKTIIVSPDGTEEEQYVTENLPHQVNKNSIRHNSHRFISLPIGMRFGKSISNIHFGIGFGLDFNYYLSGNHEVLNRDNQLTTLPVGGKWISPSLHTALNIDYPIAERWFIHSKLMYRSTKFENEISESYTLYGLDLGLKYQF